MKKLGLEGKSIERVHTWANNTAYTKYMNIPPSKRGEIFSYLTTTTPSTVGRILHLHVLGLGMSVQSLPHL
jgi:hypothetical protein